MDTGTVARLAQRIINHVGIGPATAATARAARPVADPHQLEPSVEPDLVNALERLLEDDLDRGKERVL